MKDRYIETTKELMNFINKSHSNFHAVKNIEEMLRKENFIELNEGEKFEIEKGKNYYVKRNNSSIISFKIPQTIKGFSIVAAHSDSPTFKIKINPEIVKEEKYTTLNVEGYGGMICSSWFDRPLSIAGRVFYKKDNEVQEKLISFDRDLVSIVNLAIHQNRSINDGHTYKKQKDMLPIFSLGNDKGGLNSLIAEELNISSDDILDSDLFLYNRMNGTIWGAHNEFFSSPKIDDLQCAYSSVESLIESNNDNTIAMSVVLDNEEVGSSTKQGALGDFLKSVLKRIANALNWDVEDFAINQANSFMLSADNGHSYHPNYPEMCDPVNKPAINNGVLIKYAANQKYTTDGKSAAILKNILINKDIPYQEFVNNSDVAGGGTLGNLANMHFSINTADIGAAQLAMHSSYECGGTKDTYYLIEAMKGFYER